MVSWIVTTLIGLVIAVIGAIITDYSSIGWIIGLVGVAIIILGLMTKIKYGLKG